MYETKRFIMIGAAIMLVGAICFAYRLYEIVQTDARSRGFKHPKTWGLCSISSNNGSGLLLYLIKRRKYLISELSKRIEKSKKAISAAIIFVETGAILIVVSIILKYESYFLKRYHTFLIIMISKINIYFCLKT